MNRGRRGSALGLHSTAVRIRGGFQASMLPGTSTSSVRPGTDGGTSQTTSGGGNQMIIIGSTNPVVSNQSQQQDDGTVRADVDSCDIRAAVSSILRISRGFQDQMNRIDQRLLGLEKKQDKLSDTLKEINDLVKKIKKDSFCIKGSPYEASLKSECARLFCKSLTRDPTPSDIQATVARVMGRVQSFKVELALKFVKSKLTDLRSEERRKVLGHAPYNKMRSLETKLLATMLLKQMHAPDDVEEEYIRHLALFRKFVRELSIEADIRIWLNNSSPTEEMWDAIMKEDENFDYCAARVLQDETPPHIESGVNVYTSSGGHDGNDTYGSGVEKSDGEVELQMNSLESTMKLYFGLMEAKVDKLSVYMDRLFSCVEHTTSMLRMIAGKVVSLETITGQLVQDMQGLKSRQDMLLVKQDRIQSTLSGHFTPIIRSPSSETAVAWSPSPRHASMISPTCIYPSPATKPLAINATPSALNPIPQTPQVIALAINLTPTAPSLTPAAIDPTLLVASDHVNLGNSQPVEQQPFIPPFSPPMDIDAHSTVSIDDIESIDWGRESKGKTTVRSQSDPGFPLSQPIGSSCIAKKSEPALPSRVNSDSLIDPNVVLAGLSTLNIAYDTVGRIGVSLARFSFFGDDVLRISTLNGMGKRHVGLSPHKLEAMYSFLHQLDPFRSLNKDDFVKNRVETALKDHLKSASNRSPVPKGFM